MPTLLADAYLTLASLIGLRLLARVLRAETPETQTNNRFLFGLNVITAMMAARLVFWLTDWTLFGLITFASAALIPLAALLIAEALLRRHAPPALKLWTAIGATLVAVNVVIPWPPYHPVPLGLLAGFQALSFIAIGVLVLRRDRASLSAAENTMIDRLVLSLVFIVPFALTDFRAGPMEVPVRLSGIAVLILCVLALDLRRSAGDPGGLRAGFVTLVAALLAVGLTLRWGTDLPLETLVQLLAIFACTILVAHAVLSARAIRRGSGQDSLLRYLAQAQGENHAGFVRGLQTTGLASGALLLTEGDLGDFDADFRAALGRRGLIRQADSQGDPALAEQTAWFFRKFDVTHALLVSEAPWQVLALNIPPLTRSAQVDDQLAVAGRLARQLAAREARHG